MKQLIIGLFFVAAYSLIIAPNTAQAQFRGMRARVDVQNRYAARHWIAPVARYRSGTAGYGRWIAPIARYRGGVSATRVYPQRGLSRFQR